MLTGKRARQDSLFTRHLPVAYTGGMIYDVTLPLSPTLAVWPGDPAITVAQTGDRVKVSRWTLGSHAGTHVDAPAHFSAGTGTVEQMDPAVLLGACRVVEVDDAARITADMLLDYDLPGVTRVLFRTRNSSHWAKDPTQFTPDFVALDPEAAYLLRDAGLRLIGIDGPSIECYGSDGAVHDLLLRAGIIIVENLFLSSVPPGDYDLLCAPLKLAGADGAPARVFLIGR